MHSQKGKNTSSSHLVSIASHVGAACAWLWSKSKAAAIIIALALVVGLAGGVDAIANMNRIYQGVSVGDIDLSGKTIDEATALISQEYEPRINGNDVVLCASEEVASQVQSDKEKRNTLEEQISYEETLSHRDRWTIDAQVLGATFDPAAYAQMAYQVGRDDGWLFNRLKAGFSGVDIEPVCSFNATSLDELRDEIITALGTKMVDFNVEMQEGSAHVTEGHDGYEVSQDWLIEKLNDGLLYAEGESRFVIDMQDVSVRIDEEAASVCATEIDNSIESGITFQYEDKQWFADRAQLAEWIVTEVREESGDYVLKPLFDDSRANQTIIQGFGFSYGGSDYTVQFSDQEGSIIVTTNATGTVPQVGGAIASLNDTIFTTAEKRSAPLVEISSIEAPETMSFEEACDYGLVVEISSFTTQYASGVEARNNNIHIAADALNDSICKAGETWSFLALSGETTPDKGYQDAGAIISGEYSDAIGGGICQVATTVFNAVYDAGYPIEKRYNHSLYIASYPEGRDAAIAYPDMDLVWRNDTESDVLLVMTYTNASVTATLYGVDPGYEVTTTYGEWQEGEPYRTIVRQDPDYPVGKEFVESSGTDGRSITIVRTVKDRNGNVIQEKEFNSTYSPKNKVVVQGSAQSSTSE
jgi:vancomycin resistance protein YoaR